MSVSLNKSTPRAGRPNSSTRRRIVATIIALLGSQCAACGRETIVGGSPKDGRTFNLGHVVADCNGGSWTLSNLLPACRRCNVFMGGSDWLASGAPMRFAPLPDSQRLMPDTDSEETHMDAPRWVTYGDGGPA